MIQPTALESLLIQQINTKGYLPFDDYMSTVLYHPELGYYTSSSQVIGAAGDFITAPSLSAEFSACIADFCQMHLNKLGAFKLCEFGAGNGDMAAVIIDALPKEQLSHYYICEISPTLKQRQFETISARCPDKVACVHWVESIPTQFSGVVLANEFFDALPVKRFQIQPESLTECVVTHDQGVLKWGVRQAQPDLQEAVAALQAQYPLPCDGYESEISFSSRDWFKNISDHIERAVLLVIDYGFSGREYYHADRNRGTLMCHGGHRSHPDPFFRPGTQDITAHVDFTALAEAGHAGGWSIDEFTTQAYFLLSMGITKHIENAANHAHAKQALLHLTHPQEMGELFKVMILSKNYDYEMDKSWPSLLNRL